MSAPSQQLERADRLAAVTQSIGSALWQLQELEGVAAGYFVLLVQAQKGMGLAEGNALVEMAQGKTFGTTLHQISKAGLVSPDIEERFARLLSERNWLVHRSRADSRNVIQSDKAMMALVARLDTIADESRALLKVLDAETTIFVQSHGVSMDYVAKASQQLLEKWHAADAL